MDVPGIVKMARVIEKSLVLMTGACVIAAKDRVRFREIIVQVAVIMTRTIDRAVLAVFRVDHVNLVAYCGVRNGVAVSRVTHIGRGPAFVKRHIWYRVAVSVKAGIDTHLH